jgi:hypothetical protein
LAPCAAISRARASTKSGGFSYTELGKFTEPVASEAMSGRSHNMAPRSSSLRPRPPVENWMIMPGQCFRTPSWTRWKRPGSDDGRPASSRT